MILMMNSFHDDFDDDWHVRHNDFDDDDGEKATGQGDLDWSLVGDSIIGRVAFPPTTTSDDPQIANVYSQKKLPLQMFSFHSSDGPIL